MTLKRNNGGLVDVANVKRWTGSAMEPVQTVKRWSGSAWVTAWQALVIAIDGTGVSEKVSGSPAGWLQTYGNYVLSVTPSGGAVITDLVWSLVSDAAGWASINAGDGYFRGRNFNPDSATLTSAYTVRASFKADGVAMTRDISGTYRYN